MKNIGSALKIFLFFMLTLFAEISAAYTADVDNQECKKPKFRKFSPPHKSEVAPGTDISFHVTHVVEPESIKVTAKKIPVEVEVEDKNAFYLVKGKLPDSLHGTYARITVKAGKNRHCMKKDGWLLKITEAENSASESGEQAGAKKEASDSSEQSISATDVTEKNKSETLPQQ